MSTIGRDENRSSVTELLPKDAKCVATPGFILDHYNISGSAANFDWHAGSSGQDVGVAGSSFSVPADAETSGYTSGQTFFLTDTLGNTVTFEIDTSTTQINGDTNASGNVIVGLAGANGGFATRCAITLSAVINACQPTLYISAQVNPSDPVEVWLTQQVAGPAGKNASPKSMDYMDGIEETGGSFTIDGGLDSGQIQAPFSKRFQLVRTPARSGTSVERNDEKTEG